MIEDGSRSRSHGLRAELLAEQAQLLGLQHILEPSSWERYEESFERLLIRAKNLDATHVIFGDMYPDSHKQWAELQCRRQGMAAIEPLWAQSSEAVGREFLGTGAQAIIVTVLDDKLDATFLGRWYSTELIEQFLNMGIDPCGERGEFHTFVTWCPAFSDEVLIMPRGIHREKGCSALDLVLA
jgi:diphthine-ammonia ligase